MPDRHATAGTAGAAVLLALLAIGCGGPRARGMAAGPAASPDPVSAVTGVSAPYGSQAAGLRWAHSLLARMRLPAGSQRISSPPPLLRQPVGWLALPPELAANTAGTHGLWRIPLAKRQAGAYVRSHPPGGASWSGRSDGNGVIELDYTTGKTPAWIYSAQLIVSIAADGTGRSVLRADAQAIWYPPRPAAEQLTGTHAVTVTMDSSNTRRPVIRTFTAPAVIARLVRLLNGMPASPEMLPVSCGPGFVTFSLAFAPARGARPSLVATVSGCPTVAVRANGQAQPALSDPANKLGTYAQRLVGARTPRTVWTPPDR